MFEFDRDKNLYVKVKMIGVGDFGAEMVNYSIANSILNVKFAVVGTKNETLLKSSAPQRIKVSDRALTRKQRKIFPHSSRIWICCLSLQTLRTKIFQCKLQSRLNGL